MNYSISKHAKTLELDRVLLMLSNESVTEDAKEAALNIVPSTVIDEVKELMAQTEDAYLLCAKFSSPSFGSVVNVSSCISRASLGSTLNTTELLNIADVLRSIRSLKSWRQSCMAEKELSIDYLFNALNPNKFLEDKINFAIKSPEEINDNASSLLADLRRQIKSKSLKIRESLEKIIHGQMSKYLQEALVTQRDGRFVVPVRSEFKGEIKGIVHDTSSTGSTLFIEPMSVVETNNEIRVLKSREQDEILRILSELSAMCADFSDSIMLSYDAFIKLDLIFAKAKLAYKTAAVVPKINDRGYVYLKRARHPLISSKTVVPITVTIGGEYNSLIITGPNTGGKTVTLKTIGLFNLMAMCGLMLPADDGTEITVFNKIFADIGDEQSIEQSLSTFSSHMVNIISILEKADNNSLVLFDELCAGTDPIEGAALAKAILIDLFSKNAKTVATTHYPELKVYALDTEGVENASCEFDVSTLKPTYKLILGVPGRSNAFAISKKLGLSDDIIKSANEQVTDDDMRFERVVESLENARREMELEREQVARLRAELAENKKKSDNIAHEFKLKQDKLMEQTREKAASIIETTRYKSANLLNELEELKKSLNAQNAAKNIEAARAGYNKVLRELDDEANPVVKNQVVGEKLSKMPQSGDIVIINSINRDATVINTDEKGKRVFVMSGSMKMWVKFDDLRLKKSKESTEIKKTRNVTGLSSKAERNTSGEIDIRGMASDEAIIELDKYIDDAVLSGMGSIRIIHGKGTGVLRKAVQTHLRSHRSIKTFRIGLFGEGENGVTIAELND